MAPPAGRCDHAAAASRRRSARLAAQRKVPAPPAAVAAPAPPTTTPCRPRRRLPLPFRRSDNQARLASNLARQQVVFVEAWPGTGRSSQVPRVLHAAGHGPVVCSQTYRIAAESAAAHAATNMRAGEVGCMVAPPEDLHTSGAPSTAVTYTTHQTLLRVLAADPLLARYGAVVVDEADDGMLLTAAVLSCVKATVARRPELRVVICMHSTMPYGEGAVHDFFPDAVHLWFRTKLGVLALQDFLSEPVTDYVAAAVHTVCSIHSTEPAGDVLVFLPTCADTEAAARLLAARALPGLVTRCLHDGLPVDLINEVLSPAPDGKRKAVLATDVANSAVFVDGIKYIVDSGYMCTDNALPSLTGALPPRRMIRDLNVAVRSGYHIKGRGNKGKWFCLYTMEEWREMLQTSYSSLRARTNDVNSLAGVVLVLKDLGIISGSVESFNFVLPPCPETLQWAVEALEAAGALGLNGEVTEEGRLMARQILGTCHFYAVLNGSRGLQCYINKHTMSTREWIHQRKVCST